jgi:hypothetical protein
MTENRFKPYLLDTPERERAKARLRHLQTQQHERSLQQQQPKQWEKWWPTFLVSFILSFLLFLTLFL